MQPTQTSSANGIADLLGQLVITLDLNLSNAISGLVVAVRHPNEVLVLTYVVQELSVGMSTRGILRLCKHTESDSLFVVRTSPEMLVSAKGVSVDSIKQFVSQNGFDPDSVLLDKHVYEKFGKPVEVTHAIDQFVSGLDKEDLQQQKAGIVLDKPATREHAWCRIYRILDFMFETAKEHIPEKDYYKFCSAFVLGDTNAMYDIDPTHSFSWLSLTRCIHREIYRGYQSSRSALPGNPFVNPD